MASSIRILCEYTKMVPRVELRPHPQNPNHHSETQITALAELIRAIGWRFPIVVSKRSGYIVAGHARLMAAERLGMEEVPVDFQEFDSEVDEITQLLADNKIPEMASRDAEEEVELLKKLMAENANTLLTGYLPKEIDTLMKLSEAADDTVEHKIPEMELQPHEHYDYIVLMFRRDYDWMHALQALGVQDVNYSVLAAKKKIGLGRIMDGTRVLHKLLDAQGHSQPGPLADDQHAQADSPGDAGVHGSGAAVV